MGLIDSTYSHGASNAYFCHAPTFGCGDCGATLEQHTNSFDIISVNSGLPLIEVQV